MQQMDLLISRIIDKKNPTVAGLDTRLEYLPEKFLQAVMPAGVHSFEDAAEAIYQYNCALVDALYDIVPSVKVQVAYYEMYGPAGMKCFEETMAYARRKGLSVMADVKRNDIGATAEAYAAAYIGRTDVAGERLQAFPADFATVNPYLGVDGIAPFTKQAAEHGTGIFALVKTSNPSSGQLQDMKVEDGRTVYEVVGDLVEEWGKDLVGEHGYSAVGAVVGATYPAQGAALRVRMPHTFFLVPGYGAQGATGADLAGCFDGRGLGAIVNASRSILCAWKRREGVPFTQAAREEAIRMREDIAAGLAAAGKALR